MAITKSNKQRTLTWPKQGSKEWWMHTWTLETQLEKDSLKKSLNSQSSLGSLLSCTTRCFSADQMGKRPPMDEVKEYKYSQSSPRAGHPNSSQNGSTGRAQCCTGRAPQSVRCSINGYLYLICKTPDAPTVGLVTHLDRVRWEGKLQPSLGTGPDAQRWVRCRRPVRVQCADLLGYWTGRVRCLTLGTQTRWPKLAPSDALTEHPVLASGACFSTQTLSKRDLLKTKFVPLDLRTFSELPSARFTKCAPHLNLKPCLGQATRSMPP